MSDSAGHGGIAALQSVFRIICPDINSAGTGFLHASGKIITAEHVVKNSKDIHVVLHSGSTVAAKVLATNAEMDLALLDPSAILSGATLAISNKTQFQAGTHVSTWGYPAGYPGAQSMLSVGYLAQRLHFPQPSGAMVHRWCVNAAFNSGNSGGPLLEIETGEVIGVVSSKLAPISQQAFAALSALEGQQSGMQYTATLPDGSTKNFSEGQIVAIILNELRQQVQLVIGMATTQDDLRSFLISNGIKP